jgi:hypothetical protein
MITKKYIFTYRKKNGFRRSRHVHRSVELILNAYQKTHLSQVDGLDNPGDLVHKRDGTGDMVQHRAVPATTSHKER